ncbi:hypothetical protein BDV96DRAFT_588887 [Lophiotrema nucula]|uniref:F-box domain-containing protein n=1 Tax=Lophiotrema nucula TaxID=690887 RepID=A0A6A5YK34_9PLEO|nr:hypothetical protein BDV96DRAFT_588887 [Lophiotrema nucula]
MSLGKLAMVDHAISNPQDSSRLSMILDLPLDIRLLLLDTMFKTLEPITICFAFPSENLDIYETRGLWQIRGFSGFLFTCHQLYAEARKILYHSNRFYLSGLYKGLGRSPGTDHNWEVPQAAIWLDRLGNNAQFLRHVTVLLHGPINNDLHGPYWFDLLPLVKFEWKRRRLIPLDNGLEQSAYKDCIVDFGIHDREGEPITDRDVLSEEYANLLGKLLRFAGVDHATISRYSRYPTLIQSLDVHVKQRTTTPSKLRVVWAAPYFPHVHPSERFDTFLIEDNGNSLVPVENERNIFRHTDRYSLLRNKIISIVHGLHRENLKEIDIRAIGDTSVEQPHLNLNLVLTSKAFKWSLDQFYEAVTFTVSGICHSRRAELPYWDTVTQLFTKMAPNPGGRSCRSRNKSFKINLTFDMAGTTLESEGPLINISPLLLTDRQHWIKWGHTIRDSIELHISTNESHYPHTVSSVIRYHEILRTVAGRLLNWSIRGRRWHTLVVPDVWVDTNGNIVEISESLGQDRSLQMDDMRGFLKAVRW